MKILLTSLFVLGHVVSSFSPANAVGPEEEFCKQLVKFIRNPSNTLLLPEDKKTKILNFALTHPNIVYNYFPHTHFPDETITPEDQAQIDSIMFAHRSDLSTIHFSLLESMAVNNGHGVRYYDAINQRRKNQSLWNRCVVEIVDIAKRKVAIGVLLNLFASEI